MTEGKKHTLEKQNIFTFKNIVTIICPLIAIIIGAVYFMEDRYYKRVEAAELYTKACTQDELIITKLSSKMSESEILLVQQLEQFSVKQDARYLDELHRRRLLYERLIEQNPDDQSLKDEHRSILEDIKRMREELSRTRGVP